MTQQRSVNFDPILRHLIGFENLQRQISQAATQKYPPYNIEHIRNEDQHQIQITLAVAGFKKDELKVELHDRKLLVSGKKEKPEDDDKREFAHQGISERSFQQMFQLHEYLKVKDITLESGLLTITLEQEIPEEKKPKLLEIS